MKRPSSAALEELEAALSEATSPVPEDAADNLFPTPADSKKEKDDENEGEEKETSGKKNTSQAKSKPKAAAKSKTKVQKKPSQAATKSKQKQKTTGKCPAAAAVLKKPAARPAGGRLFVLHFFQRYFCVQEKWQEAANRCPA